MGMSNRPILSLEEGLSARVVLAEAIVDVEAFEEKFPDAGEDRRVGGVELHSLGEGACALAEAADGFHIGGEFIGGEIVPGGEGEVRFELLDDRLVRVGVAITAEDRLDGFAAE